MPFAESPAVFLADFGVPCSANGQSFLAIFDQPDEGLGMAGVNVLSTMYQLTARATDVALAGLASNTSVTVNGSPYVVRDVMALDDGTFCHVTLSR